MKKSQRKKWKSAARIKYYMADWERRYLKASNVLFEQGEKEDHYGSFPDD